MSLAEILELYKGTNEVAPIAKGLHGKFTNSDLDCNCVDCGSDSNCINCD